MTTLSTWLADNNFRAIEPSETVRVYNWACRCDVCRVATGRDANPYAYSIAYPIKETNQTMMEVTLCAACTSEAIANFKRA